MRKKMVYEKITVSVCVLVLIVLSFIFVWRHEQQRAVYAYNSDNLIRLHVVANSDSEVDQALKRRVRDTIVRGMTPEIAGVENINEARSIVRADLDKIGKMAAAEVRRQGFDYPVRVCYGYFPFPVKSYGTLTLPAGKYEAVKVILGEGGGANWWCVLFPPLCFVNIEDNYEDDASASKNTGARPRIEYRLKIIEMISALCEKFSDK